MRGYISAFSGGGIIADVFHSFTADGLHLNQTFKSILPKKLKINWNART